MSLKPSGRQRAWRGARSRGRTPGIYQLHLHLPKAVRLKVGRLGRLALPAGLYVYTGSARNGVERRLARHRRRRKTFHWHIDYLLRRTRLKRVTVLRTRRRLECVLNRKMLEQPGAQVVAKGFGSSDCRCQAHLVHLAPRRLARIPFPRNPTEVILTSASPRTLTTELR